MCGIAGVFTKHITIQHEKFLRDVLKDQHARGPDYQDFIRIQGTHHEMLLGHNRLSIIDLSSDSNQPMWDATKRYCITYNGEIYNYLELRNTLQQEGYQFKTNGDTEIILNAFAFWGIEALSHFHGPFAFALYDSVTGQLWLCRDRFGVRPLYYVKHHGSIYFASSTRVLAKTLQLKPNLNYVSKGLHYLVYEDDTEESPYQNMLSLPASTYCRIQMESDGNLFSETKLYYDLHSRVKNLSEELPLENTDYLLQQINDRLNQAIHIRLRTDVPLGITLSSGLDSSSIASLVKAQYPHVTGFSYGHPDNKKTEGPLVAKCADYLKMQIHYVEPTVDEMISALFKTIDVQDAPFSSMSIVAQYLLYGHIRANNIKVILGGQGGDETFMGYRKYLLFWMKNLIKHKNYLSAAKHFLQMSPLFFSEINSLKTYWKHRHRYFKKMTSDTVLQLPDVLLQLNADSHNTIQSRQIRDITQFSLPGLLRYEDRNAMGNSVESRLPFLDHRLVELGCALPEAFKLRNGLGKWPIRQIMHKKIPEKIRMAYFKRGFDISLTKLVKAGLGRAIRFALQKNPHVIQEFLKKEYSIDQAFSDHQLIHRQRAVAEAVSLLWLSKVYV